MGSINQIILSANEDETYLEFWRPVSWAYKQMFPEVKVHLALLTKHGENSEFANELREYGSVTVFHPINGIPEFGQAKMIRFILASQQGNDVCYIDDIDLFPLVKSFITDKTDKRPKDHLLCVGGEVYNNNGCYPVSQMTAEGYIWKKFINPNDLNYTELIKSYIKAPEFDFRENILLQTDYDKDSYFSDERLIRRLISQNPVDKIETKRGYDNFMDSTIDRYDWKVDLEKLDNHGYYNAHGLRPYKKYAEKYKPLIEDIKKYY